LERQVAAGSISVTSAPVEMSVKSNAADTKKKEPTPIQVAPSGEVFAQYAELAEEMMGYPDLLPYVQKMKAVVEGGTLVFISDSFTIRMMQLGSNLQHLTDAVHIVTGKPYEIAFRERTKEMEDNPLNEL
jgi:hypothetical protein